LEYGSRGGWGILFWINESNRQLKEAGFAEAHNPGIATICGEKKNISA
jgi:hypothetical protein